MSTGVNPKNEGMMAKQGTSWTQEELPANGPEQQTDWNSVNWREANSTVRRLRQRIFRASQTGDHRKLRSLQKLMLRSYSNRLTSVRRVTQQNRGRRTAGVDKVLIKTPAARGRFVDDLSAYRPWQARPARRVYIPKANGKQRPLGIPVMRDRALQAMVKNALEPEWEARFEGTSYGFRPGRSAHDAAELIFILAKGNSKRRWVLDADIKGAFDTISHEHLLQTIGKAPGRELVRQWLTAGYVELGTLHSTDAGTPQGGVISPLLANIALHGMEQALGIPTKDRTNPRVVRYADDFVVLCHTREDAEQAQERLTEWLATRGLVLSEEKTRIVHLTEGFDFLGWNFRHYKVSRAKSGYTLLIKPSKKSVQAIRDKLKSIWMEHRGKPVDVLIQILNPVIRGWANYHRTVVSSRTFIALDGWMHKRQKRYTRSLHPRQSWEWMKHRYWGTRNPARRDRWVFGLKGQYPYLHKFAWTNIQRHAMVKGTNSPDDPNLRGYWNQRRLAKAGQTKDRKWRTIVLRQNGLCPQCGESIVKDLAESTVTTMEEAHHHHKVPRNKGGTNAWDNLVVVHLYCHQQIHEEMRRQTAQPIEPGE